MIKIFFKRLLLFFGFELRRVENNYQITSGFYSNLNSFKAVDLNCLSIFNNQIEGMISDFQGQILYVHGHELGCVI